MFSLAVVGLSYALVSGLCIYTYAAWLRNHLKCRITAHVFVLGMVLLIPAIMHLSWGLGITQTTEADIHLIQRLFSVISSAVLLLLAYRWTAHRHLLYVLGLFSVSIVASSLDARIFFDLLSVTAYVIAGIVFLDVFVDTSHHIKQGSIMGVTYAISSLMLHLALLAGWNLPHVVWAIPQLFLAAFVYMMYLDGKYCELIHPPRTWAGLRSRSTMVKIVFIRYVLYALSMATLLFITVISVHELGHALASKVLGCVQTSIIFDFSTLPHTQIVCQASQGEILMITIAGLCATLITGSILIITSERAAVMFGKLILVYGFLISAADFKDLELSDTVISTVMLASVLALTFSFIELSRYYLDSQKELLEQAHLYGKKSGSIVKRLQTFI